MTAIEADLLTRLLEKARERSPAALRSLVALAADPVRRIREAALFAAAELAGNPLPGNVESMTSEAVARLVKSLLSGPFHEPTRPHATGEDEHDEGERRYSHHPPRTSELRRAPIAGL